MLVVETFSGDNLKFNMYALIGWGKLFFTFVHIHLQQSWDRVKKSRVLPEWFEAFSMANGELLGNFGVWWNKSGFSFLMTSKNIHVWFMVVHVLEWYIFRARNHWHIRVIVNVSLRTTSTSETFVSHITDESLDSFNVMTLIVRE